MYNLKAETLTISILTQIDRRHSTLIHAKRAMAVAVALTTLHHRAQNY